MWRSRRSEGEEEKTARLDELQRKLDAALEKHKALQTQHGHEYRLMQSVVVALPAEPEGAAEGGAARGASRARAGAKPPLVGREGARGASARRSGRRVAWGTKPSAGKSAHASARAVRISRSSSKGNLAGSYRILFPTRCSTCALARDGSGAPLCTRPSPAHAKADATHESPLHGPVVPSPPNTPGLAKLARERVRL